MPETRSRQPRATRRLSLLSERMLMIWDFAVVILVAINLALLLFDSLFLIPPLNAAFAAVAPGLHVVREERRQGIIFLL